MGGSPRGGSDDRLCDMSMSAMEKNTSSARKKYTSNKVNSMQKYFT